MISVLECGQVLLEGRSRSSEFSDFGVLTSWRGRGSSSHSVVRDLVRSITFPVRSSHFAEEFTIP